MNTRIAIASGAGFALSWINEIAAGLFGISSGTVILMAATGAIASHAYELDGDAGKPKRGKKFWLGLLVNTMTATAAVSVLPGMLGWQWYNTKWEGSMAFLFALSARAAVPLMFKYLPELVRKWTSIGEYRKNKQEEANDGPVK